MKIAVGSDHRGFEVKRRIITVLQQMGHEVIDVGPHGGKRGLPGLRFSGRPGGQRGPRPARRPGLRHRHRHVHRGQQGQGVRAAPCHDSITAEMSRRHNDANVLCLSADLLGEELIERMLRIWLETEFESGRHARRVEKITRFEQQGPDAAKP